jgi:hydrogenase nickel incorporation protein HypB
MRKVVEAKEEETYDVELSIHLLKENEKIALKNRELLRTNGVKTIDVMGSIGSGKTSLIEQMVKSLKEKRRIAYIAGDLTTTIDSDLISRHGVEVVQVNTGKECHLDANLVRKALQKIDLRNTDVLFIENVGNLICPAEFPLGSDNRIVVVSVTEGPYMVIKHPFTFMNADVVVINKIDLAGLMGIDASKLGEDAKAINPNLKIVETNCRKGEGITGVIEALGL